MTTTWSLAGCRRASGPTSSPRPLAALFLGISSGLHLRDDRRDADHAPRPARHHQERGDRLRAHLPRLQLQVPLGADRRQRPAAGDRPLRAAAQLAVAGRRAGDGRRRLSRHRRSRASRSTWSRSRRSRWAWPAPRSTSSSTPIASSCSSRASSASGSGMSQYGWRIGAAAAGALALVLAARIGWTAAYLACAAFALPAMLVGVVMGEPRAAPRARQAARRRRGHGRLLQPADRVHAGARARWSCCCSC